jgi:succinyl-diaminopimelate desuccinylase
VDDHPPDPIKDAPVTLASGDAVKLTQQLLRFNTINPPGNEEPCAQFLGRLLEDAGFSVAYHAFAEQRTSVIASIGRLDAPTLGFTGHLDTVPLGSAPWSRDSFAGDLDGDKLYGRGSSDMKSGIAAFIAAALPHISDLKRSAGLTLVLTAGEETGCEGAYHLAKTPASMGRIGALIIGEPTANYPYVGHKGAFWLQAKTRGLTAHGSMPERGDNAVYKVARAVIELEKFAFESAPHALMGSPTLNVGTIRGGLNINSVPDEAVIGIDIRTVPNVDHQALYKCLCQRLGPGVELSTLLDVGSVYTEPSHPWMQQVFDIVEPLLGARPQARSATYFTDAAALNPALGNPPSVILGPGEPQLAHQTDEYCLASRINQGVEIYSQLIAAWCRGK